MKKSISIFIIAICAIASATAQTTNHKVYSLFVVSIAKFASFPQVGNDFKIVVLGKSKVFEELQKIATTKDVNGKKMNITQEESTSKIGEVQIIYLSDGKTSALPEVIKKFEGKPVIIISEREGLYRRGAGISFVVAEDTKLRVDINKTDLEKRQVRISNSIVTSIANLVI
jgi:hypothetical protein